MKKLLLLMFMAFVVTQIGYCNDKDKDDIIMEIRAPKEFSFQDTIKMDCKVINNSNRTIRFNEYKRMCNFYNLRILKDSVRYYLHDGIILKISGKSKKIDLKPGESFMFNIPLTFNILRSRVWPSEIIKPGEYTLQMELELLKPKYREVKSNVIKSIITGTIINQDSLPAKADPQCYFYNDHPGELKTFSQCVYKLLAKEIKKGGTKINGIKKMDELMDARSDEEYVHGHGLNPIIIPYFEDLDSDLIGVDSIASGYINRIYPSYNDISSGFFRLMGWPVYILKGTAFIMDSNNNLIGRIESDRNRELFMQRENLKIESGVQTDLLKKQVLSADYDHIFSTGKCMNEFIWCIKGNETTVYSSKENIFMSVAQYIQRLDSTKNLTPVPFFSK